jgi:ketosteroid isomerase-like protein
MEPIMQGAVSHPLVQKIIAYQLAMARQDTDAGRDVFSPNVIYIVPGSNPLSGRYEGPEAVMGYFGRLMEMTSGTYRISQMLWLVCFDRVTLVTKNHATIDGADLDWDEALLFEFENGRKSRIELCQADQLSVDRFFSRAQ